jgi:hypothetical protein
MVRACLSCRSPTYLLHSSKHFVTSPFGRTPIVVVLLDAADADSAITATAASDESASRHMTFSAIHSSIWCCHDIPVCVVLVVQSPPSNVKGVVKNSEMVIIYAPAMCMLSISALSLPASRTSIVASGSSESRPAMTGPAVPPLSKLSTVFAFPLLVNSPTNNVIELVTHLENVTTSWAVGVDGGASKARSLFYRDLLCWGGQEIQFKCVYRYLGSKDC